MTLSDNATFQQMVDAINSLPVNPVSNAPNGNAQPSDVIAGKTFSNIDGKDKTGTLSLSGNASTSHVLSNKTFYSNNPKSKNTGTMPNRGGAKIITPSNSNQVLSSGYYGGNITIKGDINLKPENIAKGKVIYGITGTYKGDETNLLAVKPSTTKKITIPAVHKGVFENGKDKTIFSGYSSITGFVNFDAGRGCCHSKDSNTWVSGVSIDVYVNGHRIGNFRTGNGGGNALRDVVMWNTYYVDENGYEQQGKQNNDRYYKYRLQFGDHIEFIRRKRSIDWEFSFDNIGIAWEEIRGGIG